MEGKCNIVIKEESRNNSDEEVIDGLVSFSSSQASPISSFLINDQEEDKEIEFVNLRSHKIRISKKNRIMKKHLSLHSEQSSDISAFSEENFDKLVQTQLKCQKPFEIPQNSRKLEPCSCFSWYILPKTAFKNVISDYEMNKCKKVFKDILKKIPDCHEAHFGLGKLLAHQGLSTRAQVHLEKAVEICPRDKLYKIWNLVFKNTSFKNKSEVLSVSNLFKSKV